VYLYAQPSHDHGSILRILFVEVFDSASGNTICLPIPHVKSLFNRQNGNRAHALASLVRATILSQNFWHRCQNYVHMVEDVLKAL
jgi:hypothetical protein